MCSAAAQATRCPGAQRASVPVHEERLLWVLPLGGGHHAVPHIGEPARAPLLASQCILLPRGLGRLKSQLPLTSLPFLSCPQGPLFDAAVRN